MASLEQDLDDLDRMVDTGAPKDAIRSQIRLITREVATLQTELARTVEDHQKLQAEHAKLKATQVIPAPTDKLQFRRGLYYQGADPIPFCPQCWESSNKKIHLSGPIEMMNPEVEYWECHICNHDYSAKGGENFLARTARPLSRR